MPTALYQSLGLASKTNVHLPQIIVQSHRTGELSAVKCELKLEIAQRQALEIALRKSELLHAQLLRQASRLQTQLQQRSRQMLAAQEDERRTISRELHDVIAQTLTGIGLRLAALKAEANHGTKHLEENIALTQELVQKSVNIVHQFACELRPAVLDDLGLIPALKSYMKTFTTRTGVRTHLTVFAGVDDLNIDRRTVLFRVVQEALTNVGRHAKASHVMVSIKKTANGTCGLLIEDDGRSFQVQRVQNSRGGKRLGLLGMRERIETVGGHFAIASSPGKGTTITADIPLGKVRLRRVLGEAEASKS